MPQCGAAGVLTVPVHAGALWRHFAVLTINQALSLKRDHLFLHREGWPKGKSQEFKVMVLEPVFEIGTMPGLIMLFRRYSGILTNFRIIEAESRPDWLQEGHAGSRCAEGPAGAWSACGRAIWPGIPMVGPWQYQSEAG